MKGKNNMRCLILPKPKKCNCCKAKLSAGAVVFGKEKCIICYECITGLPSKVENYKIKHSEQSKIVHDNYFKKKESELINNGILKKLRQSMAKDLAAKGIEVTLDHCGALDNRTYKLHFWDRHTPSHIMTVTFNLRDEINIDSPYDDIIYVISFHEPYDNAVEIIEDYYHDYKKKRDKKRQGYGEYRLSGTVRRWW